MVSGRSAHFLIIYLFPVFFMLAACENPPGDRRAKETTKNEHASDQVDWGREINLDKMLAMAKEGQIVEIQWHVMPNILRAQTFDGRIFHLKNEDKGVDLRKTLIDAGVKIGEGGVRFKHLF